MIEWILAAFFSGVVLGFCLGRSRGSEPAERALIEVWSDNGQCLGSRLVEWSTGVRLGPGFPGDERTFDVPCDRDGVAVGWTMTLRGVRVSDGRFDHGPAPARAGDVIAVCHRYDVELARPQGLGATS